MTDYIYTPTDPARSVQYENDDAPHRYHDSTGLLVSWLAAHHPEAETFIDVRTLDLLVVGLNDEQASTCPFPLVAEKGKEGP